MARWRSRGRTRASRGSHDDIAFSRSTDGGLTWSAPLRVNGGATAPAFLPAVAIRDDGVIGVAYYDLRANTADPNTLPTLYWLATSSDGATWTERQLAGPFDYATAALAGGRYFIGDYMGMTTIGTSFVPFFAQTTGDPSSRSDITAALARATTIAVAPLREGAPVKSTTTTAPMTAEFAQRVDANARRVLADRLPAGSCRNDRARPDVVAAKRVTQRASGAQRRLSVNGSDPDRADSRVPRV